MTICTDAANYFDRVTHLFVSLSTQYFRLDVLYLIVLFKIIQMIKMYLCISCSMLERYYTRDIRRLLQGTVQGNGVALSFWLIIAIFLV